MTVEGGVEIYVGVGALPRKGEPESIELVQVDHEKLRRLRYINVVKRYSGARVLAELNALQNRDGDLIEDCTLLPRLGTFSPQR